MVTKRKRIKKEVIQLGLNVKTAREDLGLSQSELGNPIGFDKQQMNYIEKGNDCKASVYYELAEGMGMAFEELAVYHLKKK